MRNQVYMLSPINTVIPVGENMAIQHELIKQLEQTNVNGFYISTVFLGVDHDHNAGLYDPCIATDYKPLIFETMIFDQHGEERYQVRYRSYELAMAWHGRLVALLGKGEKTRNLPEPPEEVSKIVCPDEVVI